MRKNNTAKTSVRSSAHKTGVATLDECLYAIALLLARKQMRVKWAAGLGA